MGRFVEIASARVASGTRYFAWTVVQPDATGRRIVCICSCGRVQQIARDALLSGESRGCGCRGTPRPALAGSGGANFARDLAGIENHAATHRFKAKRRAVR
jgi:hypothetical protein